MANLKDIKNRRNSVQTTMQVTRAMQMMASNNLRKAQERVSLAEMSYSILERTFSDLIFSAGDTATLGSPYSDVEGNVDTKKTLLVLISSNRGLCGVFNANVFKKTLKYLSTHNVSFDTSFLTIGKKGVSFLEAQTHHIFQDCSAVYDSFEYNTSLPLLKKLTEFFLSGSFDSIKIVYAYFFSISRQEVILEDFLPFSPSAISANHIDSSNDMICEPDVSTLYKFLIPQILAAKVHKFISHSLASEHISRMVAMQKATENANQLSLELSLMYNKLRQASVTNEILEIISGTTS